MELVPRISLTSNVVVISVSLTVSNRFSRTAGAGASIMSAFSVSGGWKPRSRRAFVNTKTLESAMEPAPSMGDSNVPLTG